jgi:hypothetical protein
MHLKKVIAELSIFQGLVRPKRGFSGITFFRCILVLSLVYIFEIYATRRIFFIPDMTHFEKKKFSRLFRPQSADRKTSYALQLAEKYFTALVIFQNSVLLGLKVYL